MGDTSSSEDQVRRRAEGKCELCGAGDELAIHPVTSGAPDSSETSERSVLLCGVCHGQVEGALPLDAKHWFCLQEAAWSDVPVVQVVSYRLLHRLTGEGWATDLIDQLYLDEQTLDWARAGLEASDGDARPPTVDSNGTELADGDSVTLIKDLDVKGAGFVAKRGTLVKNIRLTDDPENVDGRVNKVAIVLKTRFLKKAL